MLRGLPHTITFAMLALIVLALAASNSFAQGSRVIFSEDFERGFLDSHISLSTVGTFVSAPGIKNVTNFGSTRAFGFGRSSCAASCFFSFMTTLRVTLPVQQFVVSVSFKEMELFTNWGSGGGIFVDGQPIGAVCALPTCGQYTDFGRLPQNDSQPDTTFRSRTFLINRLATTIELRVNDISNSGELYIDDFVVVAQGSAVQTSIGHFAQIVSGGGWRTTLTIVNSNTIPVDATIRFYADDGSALTLPLSVSLTGASMTANSVAATVPANGIYIVETAATTASPLVGWADVQATSPLGGYAIFRSTTANLEGTAALELPASLLMLPFDNRNGGRTAFAIANPGNATTLTITITDQSGNLIGSGGVVFNALNHASMFLEEFAPQVANKAGIARLQVSSGSIAAIGLRFSSTGSFTSVPIMK